MPVEGSVTAPLQQVPWQGWEDVDDPQKRMGDWWSDGPEKDRSLPNPVKLKWDSTALKAALMEESGSEPRLTFTVRITAQDGSQETVVLRGVQGEQAEVKNLRIGISYSWQVAAYAVDYTGAPDDAQPLAESALGHFQTNPAPPRWIEVPGVTNVRDMGGWPLEGGGRVRQGLLFRGAEMNAHCAITPAGEDVMLDTLGIRTDIDLRGDTEDWGPVLDRQRVAYVNIPLASYDMIASPRFTPLYRKLFGLLADGSKYPVYLHCWGGADRTGTVAFLVGALLGMRVHDLLLDYELTSLSIWGERRSDTEPFIELLQTLALFSAEDTSLQAQVEGYLRFIGVTKSEIAAVRRLLIER